MAELVLPGSKIGFCESWVLVGLLPEAKGKKKIGPHRGWPNDSHEVLALFPL